MWAKLVAFAAGPTAALIGKGLLLAMASGMIWFAFHSYNEGIRQTERDSNRITQLDQIIKDNKELSEKLDKLQIKNEEILAETKAKNTAVDAKHSRVNTYIESPEAQKSNRESSSIIKTTIGMLRDEE